LLSGTLCSSGLHARKRQVSGKGCVGFIPIFVMWYFLVPNRYFSRPNDTFGKTSGILGLTPSVPLSIKSRFILRASVSFFFPKRGRKCSAFFFGTHPPAPSLQKCAVQNSGSHEFHFSKEGEEMQRWLHWDSPPGPLSTKMRSSEIRLA
jgi:hypothetical protein